MKLKVKELLQQGLGGLGLPPTRSTTIREGTNIYYSMDKVILPDRPWGKISETDQWEAWTAGEVTFGEKLVPLPLKLSHKSYALDFQLIPMEARSYNEDQVYCELISRCCGDSYATGLSGETICMGCHEASPFKAASHVSKRMQLLPLDGAPDEVFEFLRCFMEEISGDHLNSYVMVTEAWELIAQVVEAYDGV